MTERVGWKRILTDQGIERIYFGGRAVKVFDFHPDWSDEPKGRAFQAVYAPNGEELWGTYIGGDGYRGAWTSESFEIESDVLFVPIRGYPAARDNQLALQIEPSGKSGGTTIVYSGKNPGEKTAFWRIETHAFRGARAALHMVDGVGSLGGWLAVGRPLLADTSTEASLVERARNETYGCFVITALAIACFIWLPGCAWRAWRPASAWSIPVLVPLWGVLMLALYGLLLWISGGGSGAHSWAARIYLIFHFALATGLLIRGDRQPTESSEDALPRLYYACVSAATLAYSVVPLPVAFECLPNTSVHSRLVGSSAEHWIPYCTAVYIYSGHDGKEDSVRYFSADWSIASRGPLVPLGIAALFDICQFAPTDPPGLHNDGFPAASDGFFIARCFGILTNALAIIAVAALVRCFGKGRRLRLFAALTWVALAPITWAEMGFVWPKYLTVYFILLSAADILENRHPARAGVWAALGWLSHPLGALILPGLGLLHAHREWIRWREGKSASGDFWENCALFGLGVFVTMTPWLVYKHWLGFPDVFSRYPMGDGRGFLAALSLKSWLLARWHNVEYSLIPLAYFFSDRFRTWEGDVVNGAVRWMVQAYKTLTGNIGFAAVMPAYFAFWKKSDPLLRSAKINLVLIPLATMTVYWGYSDDGFGRNCLQPITLSLIVLAVANLDVSRRWFSWMLFGLWLEFVWIEVFSFFAAPTFEPTQLSSTVIASLAVCIAANTVPLLLWFLSRAPSEAGMSE